MSTVRRPRDVILGRVYNLVDGIIRARYRHFPWKAELIKLRKVDEYSLDLGTISNLFKAGHRIRVGGGII
jgi:predicted acyl esterase